MGFWNDDKKKTDYRPAAPVHQAPRPAPMPPVNNDTLDEDDLLTLQQVMNSAKVERDKAPAADLTAKVPESLAPEQSTVAATIRKNAAEIGNPAENATLLSKGITIKGEMNSSYDVVVEGVFEGPIHTGANVYIRNGGSVKGDVSARNVKLEDSTLIGNVNAEVVSVNGRMKGDIDSRAVKFGADARYFGSVVTDSLGTVEGASVRGSFTVRGDGSEDDDFGAEDKDVKADKAKDDVSAESAFKTDNVPDFIKKNASSNNPTPKAPASTSNGATGAKPSAGSANKTPITV